MFKITTILLSICLIYFLYLSGFYLKFFGLLEDSPNFPPTNIASPFIYSFNVSGKLEETADMEDSRSPYWWLNSGGILNIENGAGRTNFGELPRVSRFRLLYDRSNSKDTDSGYHPQNIFRLVTKNEWQNFSEETYFNITNYNLSESINRNQSNGLFFFLRYQDGENLYYAGLRVDGTAVIKKKVHGEYFTLAQKEIFKDRADEIYNRQSNPNLLPLNTWFGLKAEIENQKNGSVLIKFFLDLDGDKTWTQVLEARDTENNLDGNPILNSGHAGLRTDFMDVAFRDFRIVGK